MKIQEFTISKFLELVYANSKLEKKYYSEVYQEEFPLKGDLLAKLEPIPREDVRTLLPLFHKTVSPIHGNFQGHPYQFSPDEYFLFRYRITTSEAKPRDIHIRFRTRAEDRLLEDFLEFLQESAIIRHCCVSDKIGEINEPLKSLYQASVQDNLWLIDSPQQMLSYIKKGAREKWIRDKLSNLFDAIDLMEKAKYDINTVIERIKNCQIHSDKEEGDVLWNSALKILSTIYQR